MTSSNYDFVARTLSSFVSTKILHIPDKIKQTAQEIRLRVNRPVTISCPDSIYYITNNGCVTNAPLQSNMLSTCQRDLYEIFNNICNYSVYARQNEIKNGFITLRGGHRAGICGTAVSDGKNITNIRDISSINIRIANEHKDCSKIIFENKNLLTGGLLICGAPCSGKTTVLRDIARVLSTSHKVAVIDSRSEIAGTYKGIYQRDIGMCDILDGYSKSDGFEHSLRCLSPDVIICDEIGNSDDVNSIENAINSGVSVIATAHCSNKKEFIQKENLMKLIKLKGFKNIVFLDNKNNIGKILQTVRCDELYS